MSMRMIHLHWIEAVTDAHVHVWELGRRPQPWIDPMAMAVINRDHPVAELEAELAGAGVRSAVLVQVLNDPGETEDLLWLGRSRVVDAVVGWVDLLDPQVAERLDELGAHASGTLLAGVRHQALAEPDPAGWLQRAGAGSGAAGAGGARPGLRPDAASRAPRRRPRRGRRAPWHDLRPRPRGQGAGAQRLGLRGVATGGPR